LDGTTVEIGSPETIMARQCRNFEPGEIYHIVNRGNRRQTIFHDARDYEMFMTVLEECLARIVMQIIAFVLMPNHFHLMLRPQEKTSISTFMQWTTTTHVRRHHLRHDLVGAGHLYQAPYRAGWCNNERRALATLRYIEANPVAAGLVDEAERWEWSSLWLRTQGDPRGLLSPCPIELPENWIECVNQRGHRGRAAKTLAINEADDQSFVVTL